MNPKCSVGPLLIDVLTLPRVRFKQTHFWDSKNEYFFTFENLLFWNGKSIQHRWILRFTVLKLLKIHLCHLCLEKKLKFTLLKYKEISVNMHKIPVIYLFSELGKIWKYNIRPSSNWDQHSKTPIGIYGWIGISYVLIYVSLLKKRWRIYIKANHMSNLT